jgi:hypothetical protein
MSKVKTAISIDGHLLNVTQIMTVEKQSLGEYSGSLSFPKITRKQPAFATSRL